MKNRIPPVPKVVLHAPKTALRWLVFAKTVYDGLDGHTSLFATPNPPLAQLSTDIGALDNLETATHTRTVGSVAARDAQLVIVRADLVKVCAYVQGLVDADPSNAATLAASAGLFLRQTTVPSRPELSARPSKTVSGAVSLAARLGGTKAAHEWQWSTNGGATWTSAQTTLQGKTTISGFAPGTAVLFRHRAITKDGPDAWCAPVSIIAV